MSVSKHFDGPAGCERSPWPIVVVVLGWPVDACACSRTSCRLVNRAAPGREAVVGVHMNRLGRSGAGPD